MQDIVAQEFDLDSLFKYANNVDKYYTKLEKSIQNELWEYGAVLVWKVVILFMYEKLYQIKECGQPLPASFTSRLNSENVTCASCFDFCCIEDENIHTQLNHIWSNVESSYKSMFKNLLNDRNGLSHVNSFEDEYSKESFKVYFQNAIRLLRHLQEKHNSQLGEIQYARILLKEERKYCSEEDLIFMLNNTRFDKQKVIDFVVDHYFMLNYSDETVELIKENMITSFLKSSSFSSAKEKGTKLLKLVNVFNSHDVNKILTGVFSEQDTNNQIILAEGMDAIFAELFEKTTCFDNLGDNWLKFIKNIEEKFSSVEYSVLKIKFEEVCGKTV